MPTKLAAVPFLVTLVSASVTAQEPAGSPRFGPIIESTGPSVVVDNPTFKIPDNHVFKAVYVIDKSDSGSVSMQLITIARFLNLHAKNGFAKERVHAAAVVHGSGWMSLLSDSAYGARYNGKTNPSKRLVQELLANGVQLVLCGQTAGFRGIKREELLPGVQVAMSAMSALNYFQAQGYQYNPW